MIRFVIGLFVFAVALCAYIVNLPREGGMSVQRPLPAADVDVTRAGTDATAPLPTAIALGDFQRTTRDLAFATSSDALGLTVANILKGLDLDATALGQFAARATGPQTQLEMLMLQALQSRTPDHEIAAQIGIAARSGDLRVPDVMVRADGNIDVPALLGTVVDHVMIAAGQPPRSVAPLRDQPALVWDGGQARYTVVDQDSLADIALRFYGDVTRTDLILVANPTVLSRADRIEAGQVLVIPVI